MKVNSNTFFFGFKTEFKFLSTAPKHDNKVAYPPGCGVTQTRPHLTHVGNHDVVSLHARVGDTLGSNLNLVLQTPRDSGEML